jgi:transcription termination/antitermination protein NusG
MTVNSPTSVGLPSSGDPIPLQGGTLDPGHVEGEHPDHESTDVPTEEPEIEASLDEGTGDVLAPPADPPAVATEGGDEPSNKRWYVVKVQSGREKSIKEAIERRVKIEALEEFFGQVVIPVERVAEMRNSKRVVREKMLYPGYLMVEVEFNDRILYLFRETSGVGDFVGGGLNRPPLPMSDREVERMRGRQGEKVPEQVASKPKFDRGDRVKVKEGTFAGMEGEVKDLLEVKSLVRVELTIFGRPVPVELEYWQVEPV